VTVTETINGREYTVTQLPAKRGLRLFNRLCRIFAPPAARALGGGAGGGELNLARFLGSSLGGLSDALGMLFASLTEQEQEAILRELFEGGRYKSDAGKLLPLWEGFDDAFAGRLADSYAVAAFALRVNFGSFQDALRSAVSALSAKAEPADEPEQTSSSS
jgi:hypothetical protein